MTHSFALLSLLCLFLFSIKKLSEFAVNVANSFINLYLKKQWEKEKSGIKLIYLKAHIL